MRWRILSSALALMMVMTGLSAVTAEAAAPSCRELVREYGDARVTEAAEVAATGGQPAYCEVRGTAGSKIGFRLRLPLGTYAGRYVQFGCHGLCGVQLPPDRFPRCGPGGLDGDAAVAVTDDGHTGAGPFPVNIMDGTWAAHDQQARDDYFYRAPHAVSVASKRVIAEFYGAPPKRSYFDGCSTGGREALLLAQRYPDDFDGIVAGAPAQDMSALFGVYFTWLARVNDGPDGRPVLTPAKLPALHAAVLKSCDRLDGLTDGQIDDPRTCTYDPVRLQCPPDTDRPDCLTPAQVAVARRLYDGPRDPHGRRLYPGWASRGSELGWEGSSVAGPYGTIAPLADNYLKYAGYPIGTPHSSVAQFRFTAAELRRLTAEGAKGNAMSLDLDRFRRRGGKLVLWHGWADQSIPAVGTLDYYARLARRNGGLAATRTWARAFLAPTMYHCGLGGYRLQTFDPLPGLMDWVERGTAPDKVVASGTDEHGAARTRPVFAYPLRARYDGTGSVNDAANFVPAAGRPTRDIIRWAGEYLYTR
ncbi:tannase/feruloyl esterase family alpha/beta hydrolase [Actinomadura macrotermitis]|uniref:Mono(2-hydroxyethyl) terephthalate hydrolase n=1 Tax=Actinomadura macrotermitis TaxID=2585200 RepID=A0A7K0BXE1_9ACTN|nr:tannase/feruloyl esterase family alpha/beta hydrolase [Actinomadura macrotermitis]MQY05839.1 Mono(2-hydroxyethyl) terephthalate hydrolase [Actinomadura macrotermitis]